MIRAYKTEIKLTEKQHSKLKQDVGNVKKIYNIMIFHNKYLHEKGEGFLGGYDFSKEFNNKLVEDYPYIKLTSSKAIKQSIMDCDKAFKNFFKSKGGFPKPKLRIHNKGVYLPRNNINDIEIDRHKIKVPTYGWLRVKEKGYLPTKGVVYKSVTLSLGKNGRAYASLLVEEDSNVKPVELKDKGIGIDLGIKTFATTSDNIQFSNINKSEKVKSLEKLLKRVNKIVSRKSKNSNNKRKVLLRKNKIESTLTNIRRDYYQKVAISLVKTKPKFIAIEDLLIKSMMKNKVLAGKIGKANFYNFRVFLERKCRERGIEVRYVGTFFPSSKTCSSCGEVKDKLSLSERDYVCTCCGVVLDRDLNAAINIRNYAN